MVEHITLPPDERLELDLTGVPRWYYHEKCGRTTGMPEEIIRSYLVNPFLYNGRTFLRGLWNVFASEGLCVDRDGRRSGVL